MAYKHINDLVIENARIKFRNFSGKEGKFNRAGERSFCVVIDDPAQAMALKEDGWNVTILQARDPQENPEYILRVKVRFDTMPPKVFMVVKRRKTLLTEDTIGSLDYAEISNIDLTVNPYPWNVSGREGVTGYLKSMYVTIEEDAFAEKYSDAQYPSDDDPF